MEAKKKSRLLYDDSYLTILERVVRVEEELKYLRQDLNHLRQDLNHLRQDMNARFEDIKTDINKRFTLLMWVMGGGFAALFGLITLVLTRTL